MGLISDVLLLPVTGPVRLTRVVLERIQDQVEAEMLDEGRVQAELLEVDLRHKAGEISDAEFEAQQSALVEKLNAIRAFKEESTQAHAGVGRSDR